MNRFNFGNIVTNGIQTLSVAGTTAAGYAQQRKQRKINDLTSGLNNLSDEELAKVGEYRARQYRKMINNDNINDDNIDTIMTGKELTLENNSPQISELEIKMNRDNEWRDKFNKYIKE